MRRTAGLWLACLAAFAGASVPPDVRVTAGESATGDIVFDGEEDRVAVDLVAGMKLTAVAKPSKGSPLRCGADLLDPAEAAIALGPKQRKESKGSVTLSSFAAPATGTHFVAVRGTAAGPLGAYDLLTKAKAAPKPPKVSGTVPAGGAVEFPVDALAGSRLTVSVVAKKGAALRPRIESVSGPSGAEADLADPAVRRRETATSASLSKVVLPEFGTWRVRVTGDGGTGGEFTATIAVTPPKPSKARRDLRGASGGEIGAGEPSAIEILPAGPVAVAAGASAPLVAKGTYPGGRTRDVTRLVTWSVRNRAAATVSDGDVPGVLTGVAAGGTTVQAWTGATEARESLVLVGGATVATVDVVPTDAAVAAGESARLHAAATFAGAGPAAATADVTRAAVWDREGTALAAVADGRAVASEPGTSQVTATAGGVPSAAVPVVVPGRRVERLVVTPAYAELTPGQPSRLFAATATFSDGTTSIVTGQCAWTSDNLAAATMSGPTATRVASGTAGIRATLDGVTSRPSVVNSGPVALATVTVTGAASVGVGATRDLAAAGTFVDGGTRDLTEACTWSSSAPSVVTVSTVSGTKGRVTGVSPTGTTSVSASLTAAGSLRSGSAAVGGAGAELAGLRVVPAITTVGVAGSVSLRAIAVWSDGTSGDVTASAVWASSGPSAVTVAGGVATGVADGGAVVRATLDGRSATAVVLGGSGQIAGIALSSPAGGAPIGDEAAHTAFVSFAPATPGTHVVAGDVARLAEDPLAVRLGEGVATARRAASTSLRASLGGYVSAPLGFTGDAAVARSLTVFPQQGYVSFGADAQLAAQVHRSDGSVTDEAGTASWTSLQTNLLTVSSTGVVHAVAKGTATVRAVASGVQGETPVAVAGDVPTITSVSPSVVNRGQTGVTLTLTGTALDGIGAQVSISGSGVTLVSGPTPNAGGTQATVTIDVAVGAATGLRDVTYTTVVGSATRTGAIQIVVPAPAITSVSPSNIDIPGTGSTQTTVTVTGSGFTTGDTFTIGSASGVSLGTVTVVNATTLTAPVTVQSTAAKARLTVTVQQSAANGGATAAKANALKIGPADPVLTSVTPAAFHPGQQGAKGRIAGSNFQNGIAVAFPEAAAAGANVSVTSATSTQIDFTVSVNPNATIGLQDVTLTNPNDLALTFADVFAIAPRDPAIASVSFASLARGVSNLDVTVRGTNFRTGAQVTATGTGVTFTNVTVVDPEKITARVSVTSGAALGARDLTVAHAASEGGRGATRRSAFTVVAASPTVASVNPAKVGRTGSGGASRRVPVAVTGTNFSAGATLSVTRSGGTGVSVTSAGTTVVSDTLATCVLDVAGTATTGLWDVKLTNPAGGGDSGTTGASKLEIVSETTLAVNRVTPDAGGAFGGERVTVEGSGFVRGCRVEFGAEKAVGVQFLDQNTLVCTVPRPADPSSSGGASVSTSGVTQVDVKVTNNPGGSATTATLTKGWSYGRDLGPFQPVASFPADGSTTGPQNLKSAVLRLSHPANPHTVVFGSTSGTNCYWFQANNPIVSGQTGGFGADRRFLVFSRTGTGNLPASTDLQGNTNAYILEVPTAAKSSSGRALLPVKLAASGNRDQWRFTLLSTNVDSAAPTVASTFPASGATGVGTTVAATVTFGEEIDPLTVTTSTMQLKQGTTALSCVVTLSDDLRTVTIAPTEELARNTTYTISIAGTVADLCGNAVSATTRTFTTAATDTTAPTIDFVTVAELPSSVDGSGTYVDTTGTGGNAFDAYLPTHGWSVVVRFSDAGDGVDPATFSARANCAVGALAANAELASKFEVTGTSAAWTVGSSDAFAAQNDVTLTFTVRDRAGNTSTSSVVTLDTVGIDTAATGGAFSSGGDHDPFDTREVWVLRFDTDRYTATLSTTGTPPSATQQCTTTGSGNGIPDVEEALRLCGLQSDNMTANASACVNGVATGTNAIVLRLFQERVRATLRARFGIAEDGTRGAGAPNVEFLLPGEQGSLSALPTWSSSSSSSSARAFSEMDLGGDTQTNSSQTGVYGTVGQAFYDVRNRSREANLNAGSAAFSNNNGVFCINLFKSLSNVSRTGTSWGVAVTSRFLAAKGGTPVGEGTNDHVVLAGTFDRTSASNTQAQNDRYDQILDAVELAAMSVSAVAAHEIGHSVGLVPDGAPKSGFFGGAHHSNSFTEATSGSPNTTHHLDFLGNDVMPAAASVDDRTATGSDFQVFNPMERNYLGHRQVHDEGR
jgi:hypothetical protein